MQANRVANLLPSSFSNFLLATRRGVVLTNTGDAVQIGIPFAQYRVRKIVVRSPSANVSAGFLGVWTAASQGGTNLVANAQLSSLTTALNYQEMTITAAGNITILTAASLFVNVGTAVAGATVEIDVYGDVISVRE